MPPLRHKTIHNCTLTGARAAPTHNGFGINIILLILLLLPLIVIVLTQSTAAITGGSSSVWQKSGGSSRIHDAGVLRLGPGGQ